VATTNRRTPRPDPALIRTKFARPPGRPGLVERQRLLDLLDQAGARRITLLSAPPGFGKTTLVTQWLTRQSGPAAWLALDRGDSDPERFVRYLVAAIEENTLRRLPESAALLASRTPPPFAYLCEVLVAELAATDERLVLVLEDYHAIKSEPIHRLVERLVQTMPTSMHLLVLSRVDPPGRWGTGARRGGSASCAPATCASRSRRRAVSSPGSAGFPCRAPPSRGFMPAPRVGSPRCGSCSSRCATRRVRRSAPARSSAPTAWWPTTS